MRGLGQSSHFDNKAENYEPERQSAWLRMTQQVTVEMGMWVCQLPSEGSAPDPASSDSFKQTMNAHTWKCF